MSCRHTIAVVALAGAMTLFGRVGAVIAALTGSLEAVTEQAAGGYSAPQRVSAPRTLSRYPTAAATSDCAILVWGEGYFDRERLVYSVREAAGAITAPRALATGVLREAALAGAGSHAVVAWIEGHRLGMAELNG